MTLPPHIKESPDDVLSTMSKDGKRKWLYPTLSPGKWLARRRVVAYILIVLYLALPIFKINGKPAIFLDLLHRQFTFFGHTFYPTDTPILVVFGLLSVFGVVLLTALAGRVWCGWGCPQTVYLEFVYRPIERLIEGKPNKAKRRDDGEHDFDWWWRKVVKWTIFTLISTVLAHTFVAYFASWDLLLTYMKGNPSEHWGYFVLMIFMTGLVLFDFGFFREQMCTITCPYARIQSVLFDPNSLIVSYDTERGEPRGKGKKRSTMGDCVDCGACVRTCPTGIDIRDGLQMECLSCTQCIDACDDIMEKLGQPGGLIRYTSELALKEKRKTQWIRPRVVAYSAIIAILVGVFSWLIINHQGIKVYVTRAVGAPFTTLPDGQIANRLKLRVRNRGADVRDLKFKVLKPEGATLKTVGPNNLSVPAGEMRRMEVWITVPKKAFKHGKSTAVIEVKDGKGGAKKSTTLVGPFTVGGQS